MYEIIPFILPGIMLVIATGMVIYSWILDWRIIEGEEKIKKMLREMEK